MRYLDLVLAWCKPYRVVRGGHWERYSLRGQPFTTWDRHQRCHRLFAAFNPDIILECEGASDHD